LSSADWSTFNGKQGTITLTTTGTSGAATFSANTLNIPNYGSALSGYLPLSGGTLTGQTLVSYVMGADNGFIIQHSNLTQGISIGYNTIKTSGTSANQNLTFYSQGTGVINLVSNTQVNGIFTALSTITGTTIYGSTAVCSPVGLFSGCVGIGTSAPNASSPLHIKMCSNSNGDGIRIQAICSGAAGSQPGIAFANVSDAKRWSISLDNTSDIIQITNAAGSSALIINQSNITCFACQVCLPTSNTSLVAGTYGTISNVGGIDTNIGNNAYYDGTNWRRFAAQEAARIYINRDSFSFLRKASDGAGSCISWDNTLFLASSGIACFAATVCAPLFTTTNGVAAIGAGPSSTEIFTATGPGSSNGMYLVIYSQQGTAGSATGMAYLNIWNNTSVDVFNIFCQSLSNVTNSGTSVRIQTLSGNGGFTAVYSVIRLR